MAAGDKGIVFKVTDTQTGRKSLIMFEQYSTFEKRCKEEFQYPLGVDVEFELEDDAVELDESVFECLDNMTKLRIRPTHEQLKKRNKDMLKNILEVAEEMGVRPLAITVTGSSGEGKSSLINALRDLNDTDKGWAPVGETETTMECRAYTHPTYPNLVFWDVPGAGTKQFPRKTYLSTVKFDRYDFYIICSRTRFTEDDLWLVQEVKKRQKKCYFLRTKVDQDIQNAQRRTKKLCEREELNEIRKYSQENLSDECKVFLINSFDKFQYDFPIFLQTLLADAAAEQIRLLTHANVSAEMSENKSSILKCNLENCVSARYVLCHFHTRDFILSRLLNMHKKNKEYQRQFELPDSHV